MKTATATSAWLLDEGNRLDASFHLSDGREAKLLVKKSPHGFKTLETVSLKLFNGSRFKRAYVDDPERGYPYLTASDMTKAEPYSGTYLSKKMTGNTEGLMLHKDWLLISCSGTIGKVVFTNEDFEGQIGTHDLIRILPNAEELEPGYLYAFLTSKYGYAMLTQSNYGGVVKHIEPHHITDLPIPMLPERQRQEIHGLVEEAARLRVEGNGLLQEAREQLLEAANLPPLRQDEYEYFGSHAAGRELSVFTVKNLDPVSIAAFNYSARIAKIIKRVKDRNRTVSLYDSLSPSKIFSTGSFRRLESPHENGIQLVNQSDIFDYKIRGKNLYKRFVKNQDLVEYGEVLIAGVGTLGENETFCRVMFAGEDLTGRLVSGEFSRMKTCDEIPSGYLYAWLSTDYGFRMIRSTQAGTKLCRPILKLLYEMPVPVLSEKVMFEIDEKVREAHSKRYEGLTKETKAITILENEISSWQPSKKMYTEMHP